MASFTDQLNRSVDVASCPRRIVSLVPSQTELLFDLGLRDEVAGITSFCVHPREWFQTKARIGGTKKANVEKIKSLRPDLILANKEENVKEQVEELAKDCPVWVSDVNTLADALRMIEAVGELTLKIDEAKSLSKKIAVGFESLPQAHKKAKACYLIWREPYMTVGGDTFISDMLDNAGFENAFAQKHRYPIATIEEMQQNSCGLILLSSEPYPFKQKHVDELHAHLPQAKIVLVDGEMFSWYGSRLQYAPAYFTKLQKQIAALP